MKTKLLTAAIAAASVMVSGMAVAGDHGSNAIKTALANAKLSGEIYAGFTSATEESTPGIEEEAADFNIDSLLLGLTTNISDDVELGIEVEKIVDPFGSSGGLGSDSSFILKDLYAAKSYGNTVVTLGRFKQIADREGYIERSDSVFNRSSDLLSDNETSVLGATRRIDGIEVKSHNDTGLHGSFSLYKDGIDFEEKANGDEKASRTFGYAGSVGWQGGNNDMQFGVTLSAFQENGDEDKFPGFKEEDDRMGYSLETFIATGPFVGALNYGDMEEEFKDSSPDKFEDSSDSISVWGTWDLSNAGRSFNEYGVLQGPKLSKGEMGYEVGFSYATGDDESKENGTVVSESDTDSWGLAFNMYCGPYSKWFVNYTSGEEDFTGGGKDELDVFSVGGRLDF